VTFAPRIVSLVPSITELLVDLGLGNCIAGRTGFCIHPQAFVTSIAKVGGTKDVNLAKIRQLAPSHVIVNMDENELPTVQALREFVPRVIVTHPRSPQDNLALIDQLQQEFAPYFIALRIDSAGARGLKDQISYRLDAILSKSWVQQRVLYLIWRDPWMTVARDTYISRMLALIGWQTWPQVQGEATGASRYPVVASDAPWLAQVDRVLLSSEPYRFDTSHVAQVQTWMQSHNPAARVQLVDGELLSWYGSRSIPGLAYLAELGVPGNSDAGGSA
jgi:ABC-type Fe3+-hydroxamate transport system substrate-binding protein